jgi:hypothetical protein
MGYGAMGAVGDAVSSGLHGLSDRFNSGGGGAYASVNGSQTLDAVPEVRPPPPPPPLMCEFVAWSTFGVTFKFVDFCITDHFQGPQNPSFFLLLLETIF